MFQIGERVLVMSPSGVQWSAVVEADLGDLYRVRYEGSDVSGLKTEDELKRYKEAEAVARPLYPVFRFSGFQGAASTKA